MRPCFDVAPSITPMADRQNLGVRPSPECAMPCPSDSHRAFFPLPRRVRTDHLGFLAPDIDDLKPGPGPNVWSCRPDCCPIDGEPATRRRRYGTPAGAPARGVGAGLSLVRHGRASALPAGAGLAGCGCDAQSRPARIATGGDRPTSSGGTAHRDRCDKTGVANQPPCGALFASGRRLVGAATGPGGASYGATLHACSGCRGWHRDSTQCQTSGAAA